mgnify:CR=1 FL=1
MFQKENFSNILKKILTNYDSIQDFANHVEMDRGYLSRNINMKLENPPTPKILKKIADNSKGVTTYEELMEVCGYLDSKTKSEYYETSLIVYQSLLDILDNYPEIELSEDEGLELADNLVNYAVFGLKDENLKKELKILLDKYIKNSNKDIKKMFIDLVNKVILKMEEQIKELEKKSKNNYVKIPVVGTVAAGEPILAQENITDYEELPAEEFKDGEYFGLKIKGDSMFPRILEGDVVIVRQQSDCDNGKIAVVLINGDEATVKQIKKTKSGLMLIPYNKKYDPMFFTKEEIETKPVKIIGVVKRLIGYNFE